MQTFQDKRILVTGGSAGIGRAIVAALAREGAQLAVIARGEAALKDCAAPITAGGGVVHTFPCDVQDTPAMITAVTQAVAALGGLDGVIANSGYCRPGTFLDIPLDDLHGMVNTNLGGVITTVHTALPALLEHPESFIVLTSSPAGNASIYGFNVYGATKAALNHLAHGLRAEYGERGVHVLTLLPPDTDTPGYQHEAGFYPPETRAILQSGRLHPAESVAAACLDAIRSRKRRVTIGGESKLLLPLVRHAPRLWEWYCRGVVRKTRRKGCE